MDTQRGLAKLTLTLHITGVRGDGYHLLAAEMVSLDLADTLAFSEGDGLEVVDLVAGGMAAPVPDGDDNLVRRALDAVGRRASVRLEKRIPAGGGLGGGSADAAAVLRWAGCHDATVAARIGADVAFCIDGGRAMVTGIGDVLEPLPFTEGEAYTLVTPPFGVSTVDVFRAWDDLGGPIGSGPNDLEVAALAVEPRLAQWRDHLGAATGRSPVLAGSGSTWFVPGAFAGVERGIVARTAKP